MGIARVVASVVLSAGLCASAAASDREDEGIDCAHPTTTMESDLCASDVAVAADVELNAIYAQARLQLVRRRRAATGAGTARLGAAARP